MKRLFSLSALVFSMMLILTACGGGGGGGGNEPSGGGGTTTVSGKVTLSGTSGSSSKPLFSTLNKVMMAVGILQGPGLSLATVELYNADHPEWIYPVAVSLTGSDGSYTLSSLIDADVNHDINGNPMYTDGDPIPAGNYTVIATKYDPNVGKLFIATQAVVKNFDGPVTNNDLVAQDSDAVPAVVSMFGESANTDGTYGKPTDPTDPTSRMAVNNAIQVTFNMAMARLSVIQAITIKDPTGTVLPGKWKISPDLLSAQFVPLTAPATSTVYTVTIGGGTAGMTAKNIYGKPLPSTVKGYFKTASNTNPDVTPPAVTLNSPTGDLNNVPVTAPIRIASNEVLDINSIAITSNVDLGARPLVQYVGSIGAYPSVNYVYEIIPSVPLKLDTLYKLAIKDAKDLAGNVIDPNPFPVAPFHTEVTSAGITGTNAALIEDQLAVKNVMAKWVRAINDRNAALLVSYMSGDFSWEQDPQQISSEDVNKDGRLSLNEFVNMITSGFGFFAYCGLTLTGDVQAITVNESAIPPLAVMEFGLSGTYTSTDPNCSQVVPDANALHAVLQKINGTWILVGGSDVTALTGPIPPLSHIDLVAPVNSIQFGEPTTGEPLAPTFSWLASSWTDTLGTTHPFATYAVIAVDTRNRYDQSGWVALVDGSAAASGDQLTAAFSTSNGYNGDHTLYVLPQTDAFGIWNNNNKTFKFKSGGSYMWTVVGFKTGAIIDFAFGLSAADAVADIGGSSTPNSFTVGGTWQELKVIVSSSTGTVYPYSEFTGGYNVGANGNVNLTVITTRLTATTLTYDNRGYTILNDTTTPIDPTHTAHINNLPLSQDRNEVNLCDAVKTNWNCPDDALNARIVIKSDHGGPGDGPKITVSAVSGYTCASAPVTMTAGDPPVNQYYYSDTVCTVDVNVLVSSPTITNLHLSVWANNAGYSAPTVTGVPTDGVTPTTFTGVKVYNGWNSINIQEVTTTGNSGNHQYNFNIETKAGSTYIPPVQITSMLASGVTATMQSNNNGQSYWAAGDANKLDITVQFNNFSGCQGSGCQYVQAVDPNYTWIAGGTLTPVVSGSTGTATVPSLKLYKGWNYVNISDGNNWHQAFVYTTGGTVWQPNNVFTNIGSMTVTTPLQWMRYQYDAGNTCTLTITGSTIAGSSTSVGMQINSYDPVTGTQHWNSRSATTGTTDLGGGRYEYTFSDIPLYPGDNTIDAWDAFGNWQGVEVKSTAASCP